jgi:hypothetical protein
MLIPHIIIALSSIGFTGYVFLRPSKNKLYASYILVAATIATGTYLVMLMPSHMVSSCITGLIYLGVVMSGVLATRHKLEKVNA